MIAIDLYFLMNAAYDMALLAVTGMVSGEQLRLKRVVLSASAGALWSSAALWVMILKDPSVSWAGGLAGKSITYLLMPVLMCRIAFGKRRRRLRELVLYFYLISALTGGWMFLLRQAGFQVPSWILMPVCAAVSLTTWRLLQRKSKRQEQLWKAELFYQGRQLEATALLDSGNTLCTGRREPVHILAPSVWKQLVGEDPWLEESGCFPLFYQTVGESSVMPGIYLDRLCISRAGEKNVLLLEHAAAGLGRMELDGSGGYQMLLNPAGLDGKNMN